MNLSKLLEGITVSKMFRSLYGQMAVTQEMQIGKIRYDSRKVQQGDLFIAIRGVESDGHKFISSAISNGACAVVVEDDAVAPDPYFLHNGVMKIVVPNSRIALGRLAINFFDNPSTKMAVIGVTGTNGKTTTTHIIKSILEQNNKKTGLIGTIEYKIGDKTIPATHTTPESLEVNELLSQMISAGCSSVVMEVSSHALHQHRIDGVVYAAAVFTNLTQDHLDYHGSMEEYFKSKKILFDQLSPDSWAIINVDDQWGKKLAAVTKSKILTYGTTPPADICAENISLSMNGTAFTISYKGEKTRIESRLIGRFNVSNILAAFAAGITQGIQTENIVDAIRKTEIIRGRFEQIVLPDGRVAIIDYAHTHDALEKTLKAIHEVFDSNRRGRVITVFGCGGNRDRGKRSKMANIATSLSDMTIITSDNPRHEDPDAIIDEVMKGAIDNKDVHRRADRKDAILMALDAAKTGDVILIAGKGHEDYQVVGDSKIHFSDREIVEEYMRSCR